MAENDQTPGPVYVLYSKGPFVPRFNLDGLKDSLVEDMTDIYEAQATEHIRELAGVQAKANHYRRQRNGLLAIIVGVTINSYLNARKQIEADRVNPPREM